MLRSAGNSYFSFNTATTNPSQPLIKLLFTIKFVWHLRWQFAKEVSIPVIYLFFPQHEAKRLTKANGQRWLYILILSFFFRGKKKNILKGRSKREGWTLKREVWAKGVIWIWFYNLIFENSACRSPCLWWKNILRIHQENRSIINNRHVSWERLFLGEFLFIAILYGHFKFKAIFIKVTFLLYYQLGNNKSTSSVNLK